MTEPVPGRPALAAWLRDLADQQERAAANDPAEAGAATTRETVARLRAAAAALENAP